MTNEELSKIQKWLDGGAKLLVGRDYDGRRKIKISHGPLKIFTHRFSLTEAEYGAVKKMLESRAAA